MRILLLLLIPGGLFSGKALSQCSDFADDFETGTLSPAWSSVGSMTTSVTTTSPATGLYRLEGAGGTSDHLSGIYTSFTAATPSEMSWWIYPVGNSSATSYFVAGDNMVSAGNCIVFSYYQGSSGNIRFISGNTYTHPASTDTWYHIELKNIDWTNHIFDIYIDGTLVSTASPFRSATQNNVSTVHLYNYDGGTGVWDDIKIGGTPITFSSVATNALCYGANNGSIDLTATSSNSGPLSYLWSDGTTTEDAANLAAGSYDVLITDNLGCTANATNILVNEPTELTGTVSAYDAVCSYSSDGAASISASGGTGAYLYSWSNSQSTDSISGLAAGTYYCTVEDVNGCQYLDSVEITAPPAISVQSVVTDPANCGGQDGTVDLTVSNGVPSYNFDWNNGASTEDLSGLSAGTYVFTVTDLNGCSYADSVVLLDPMPTPVTFSLPFESLCTYHNAVTLSGAVPTGGVYSGNGVTGSEFDPGQTGSGMQVILYTFTDANNCISTAQDTLLVDPCLGIEEESPISVSMWPNPASNQLMVTSEVKLDCITIRSLSGQTLQKLVPAETSVTLDLSEISAGTYFVVFDYSGKQLVQQLVRQ